MNTIYYNQETRTFGIKSKLLAIKTPSGWIAKEATKYGFDNKKGYKRHRWGAVIKGHFTPLTSVYGFKTARKMHLAGKSPAEIREFLNSKNMWIPGILELITMPVTYSIGQLVAMYKGLEIKFSGKRKRFKEDLDY